MQGRISILPFTATVLHKLYITLALHQPPLPTSLLPVSLCLISAVDKPDWHFVASSAITNNELARDMSDTCNTTRVESVREMHRESRFERPAEDTTSMRNEDLLSPSPSEPFLKTGRRIFGTFGSLHQRGVSLTGSLRNMASRAAARAHIRQEVRTYEASLINEGSERVSIYPARSMQDEASRPSARRLLVDTSIPGPEFQAYSQVIDIRTPSASHIKQSHDSDAASLGPHSVRDIQFLSNADHLEYRPRLYSLHNPDQHVSTIRLQDLNYRPPIDRPETPCEIQKAYQQGQEVDGGTMFAADSGPSTDRRTLAEDQAGPRCSLLVVRQQ